MIKLGQTLSIVLIIYIVEAMPDNKKEFRDVLYCIEGGFFRV